MTVSPLAVTRLFSPGWKLHQSQLSITHCLDQSEASIVLADLVTESWSQVARLGSTARMSARDWARVFTPPPTRVHIGW